jgi:hypothetical protein
MSWEREGRLGRERGGREGEASFAQCLVRLEQQSNDVVHIGWRIMFVGLCGDCGGAIYTPEAEAGEASGLFFG